MAVGGSTGTEAEDERKSEEVWGCATTAEVVRGQAYRITKKKEVSKAISETWMPLHVCTDMQGPNAKPWKRIPLDITSGAGVSPCGRGASSC